MHEDRIEPSLESAAVVCTSGDLSESGFYEPRHEVGHNGPISGWMSKER